jgi:hypothetical protein
VPVDDFIYPRVEVGGEPHAGPIEKSFSFQDTPDRADRVR